MKLHDAKLSSKKYQIHISATTKWLTMIEVAGKQFLEGGWDPFRQHVLSANHLLPVTLSKVSYFSALTLYLKTCLPPHFQTIICCPLLDSKLLSIILASINDTDTRIMYVSFRDCFSSVV